MHGFGNTIVLRFEWILKKPKMETDCKTWTKEAVHVQQKNEANMDVGCELRLDFV